MMMMMMMMEYTTNKKHDDASKKTTTSTTQTPMNNPTIHAFYIIYRIMRYTQYIASMFSDEHKHEIEFNESN